MNSAAWFGNRVLQGRRGAKGSGCGQALNPRNMSVKVAPNVGGVKEAVDARSEAERRVVSERQTREIVRTARWTVGIQSE